MKSSSKFSGLREEDDDDEETSWSDSYSDLMTDLLAVFVILFSFAMMTQAATTNKLAASKKPIDVIMEQSTANSLFESINSYINDAGLSKQLSVTDEGNNKILLRVKDSIFFESGRADIKPDAKPILGKISEIMTEYGDSIKMVRIEGHTDNRPINTKQFNSNWELSTSRAVNVLRRLLEISKLGKEKFSAVGYAEFHPITANNTAINMAKNRRVDFIIETVDD